MYDRAGKLLYVGKAVNLRQRLGSYRFVHPRSHPPRLLRLVSLVESIEWEHCGTEEEALLRENALLRQFKPPFNILNTTPESYGFIGFRDDPAGLHFHWSMSLPGPGSSNMDWYGAFRTRTLARHGYSALLRIHWWALTGVRDPFRMPGALVGSRTAPECIIPWGDSIPVMERLHWAAGLHSFLAGRSLDVLDEWKDWILGTGRCSSFMQKWLDNEFAVLARFHMFALTPLRRMRQFESSGSEPLAQHLVDDVQVRIRFHADAHP